MSDVLTFPGKFLPLQQLIEEHVSKIKDIVPESLCKVFLNMDCKGLRDSLHCRIFEHLAWGLFKDYEDKVVGVSFNSQVRPLLIPEFGTTKGNDFLSFYWTDYNPNLLIEKTRTIPIEEISQSLSQYYTERFPEISTSNRISFSYAILSSIWLHDKFIITHYGFDENEDCFVILFNEIGEDFGVCRQYSMKCDFVPILLDSIALDWYTKNNPEKS